MFSLWTKYNWRQWLHHMVCGSGPRGLTACPTVAAARCRVLCKLHWMGDLLFIFMYIDDILVFSRNNDEHSNTWRHCLSSSAPTTSGSTQTSVSSIRSQCNSQNSIMWQPSTASVDQKIRNLVSSLVPSPPNPPPSFSMQGGEQLPHPFIAWAA